MSEEGKLEKKYLITNVRAESKEIMSLEVLDETSTPQAVKRAVFWLANDEYAKLGEPSINRRIIVQVTVEPKASV